MTRTEVQVTHTAAVQGRNRSTGGTTTTTRTEVQVTHTAAVQGHDHGAAADRTAEDNPEERTSEKSSVLSRGAQGVANWLRNYHFSPYIQNKFLEANVCGEELKLLTARELSQFGLTEHQITRFHIIVKGLQY